MKKVSLFTVILGLLFSAMAGVGHGWQGRMAGMGDPFGLVPDESDFLIHPSMIADGKGINFYGDYRYIFNDVGDWNVTQEMFDSATGDLLTRQPFRASGDENRHRALLGSALPLGPGRMGIFIEYSGKRSDFSGDENQFDFGSINSSRFDLNGDIHSFDVRLLYGLSINAVKLGSEIQLAYRDEENKTFQFASGGGVINFPLGGILPPANLFHYMIPHDSRFWEILFKESLNGSLGPMKIALTARGGFIFEGENKYNTRMTSGEFGKFKGDAEGWGLGGDLWLKYDLTNGLSLPFSGRIDYQRKKRDGFGPGNIFFTNGVANYVHEERGYALEAGGGINKEFSKGATVSAGAYYGFLSEKTSFWAFGTDGVDFGLFDYNKYPDRIEHQIILKLAGEKEVSPMLAVRMGVNFFYGWVYEDLKFNEVDSSPGGFTDEISLDGNHWGIGVFAGGTIKLPRFALEPFLGAGYKRFKASGNGFETATPSLEEMDKLRKEWFVGGGFSIRY